MVRAAGKLSKLGTLQEYKTGAVAFLTLVGLSWLEIQQVVCRCGGIYCDKRVRRKK